MRKAAVSTLFVASVLVLGHALAPSVASSDNARVLLHIPARDHAPERPDSGWCGETAIQEALLHYGAFVPQRRINRAGDPRHADLYASEIPVAMKALGLTFRRWDNEGDLDDFIEWIEKEIRSGHPVLAGVKIYPTDHPQWGLDHFVLVVGFDSDALLMNTTWSTRVRRTHTQLASSKKGFAFRNRYRRYYGFAIDGFAGAGNGSVPVRLAVRRETRAQVRADVVLSGLDPGKKYHLARYTLGRAKPTWTRTFTTATTHQRFPVTLDKTHSTRFRCHLVEPADKT